MSVKNKAGVKNEAGRAVLLLGAMGFWVMGDNYAASPMLVDIAQDFGLEIGTAAMVVVAYMIPFGLFTFIFGPLGDRYGKLRIIAVASFGTAIFSSLGALALICPHFWLSGLLMEDLLRLSCRSQYPILAIFLKSPGLR